MKTALPLRSVLLALLPIALAHSTGMAQTVYPNTFLWGTAMSAHQVEGLSGGGQNADWYPFEHTPGHIYENQNADVATDHWDLYQQDFQLASAIGVNTVRTSVAWEKIEPSEGQFNPSVIQHYRTELLYIRSLGIRPMITLLHGTVPLWFQARGGWQASDSPQQFASYVDYVVTNLGDLCDLWATINEPTVLFGLGYLEGAIPPQIASPVAAIVAAANLARAHRLATATVHALQPLPAPNAPGNPLRGVGLVNSLDLYAPYNELDLLDDAVTALYSELSNWAFPKAAINANFEIDKIVGELLGKQMPGVGAIDNVPMNASPTLDWIGVNFYTLWDVQFKLGSLPNLVVPPAYSSQTTDIGRAIYPQGVETILRQTAAQFPGIPLVMTENGVSDAADNFRPQYIQNALHYLDLAKFGHDGLPPIDVRGYYHWTLTDDFEWQYGYFSRYGLIEVDYQNNLERIPRTSATVYCQQISLRMPTVPPTLNCSSIR